MYSLDGSVASSYYAGVQYSKGTAASALDDVANPFRANGHSYTRKLIGDHDVVRGV